MNTSTSVQYEKRRGIAYVTLNRPAQMNAIDPNMQDELSEVWEDFDSDGSVEVAILTGAGEAFCAGMDLKSYVPEFVDATPQDIAEWAEGVGLGGLPRGYHWIDKPVIAAINGWAVAGGFELALAADIRIASEHARLGSPEARRGFHHGDGGLTRLVNLFGLATALELVLTAEPIDAQRALQFNLVSRVVPHERLMESAEEMARTIQRNDAAAVRSAKRTLLQLVGRQVDDQLDREVKAAYALIANNPTVPALLEEFYGRSGARHAAQRDDGV